MTGHAVGPRIIPSMAGVYGDPQLFDIQQRRLTLHPYHQSLARAVILQTIPPVLNMLQLDIDTQYIILYLLIPGIFDLPDSTELRDPIGIAGDSKNIHRDPG